MVRDGYKWEEQERKWEEQERKETRISRNPKQNEGKPMCFHNVETRFHLKTTYFLLD